MSKKYFDATGVSNLMGIRTKEVEVPGEDGAVVIVCEISAQDFTELGARFATPGKSEISGEELVRLFPDIISRCVLDGDHNTIFTPGQVRKINYKYTEWLTELAMTALELAGVGVVDQAEGEPEKNA